MSIAAARGRVAKEKQRLLVLDHPDPEKLPAAVQAGIWDCIKLYTEAPPKGARTNFGLAAYQHWAKLLVDPKPRMSWAKQFAAPAGLLAGLTSVFNHVAIFGKDGNAERLLFADFLDEAAVILGRPALVEVAQSFRSAGRAWDALGEALLPDSVAPLGRTRTLMLRRHHLFLERGSDALLDIRQIDGHLAALKRDLTADFPLDDTSVAGLLGNVRDHVIAIHDIEAGAVTALRDAMR